MGVSEIPSPSWSILSPLLLQPVSGLSSRWRFLLAALPAPAQQLPWTLSGGITGGSTKEQGSGWPEPRDAVKATEQGSGRVPKGTEIHGALEDKTPEEPPWGADHGHSYWVLGHQCH